MSKKDTRLNGLYPLAYMGVNPQATPLFFSNNRGPTVNDKNYDIGTLWLDTSTLFYDLYMLVDLSGGVALWIRFPNSLNTADEFITDAGTAVPALGRLNVVGDGATVTSGTGNTLTTTLTNGADGQLFIGDGLTMALANITSTGGTIAVTNGPNSINLEDLGIAQINVLDGDTGTATPVGKNINFLGGTNISTAAAGDIIVVSLNITPTLSGTLTLSALGAGVMQTNASGVVTSNNGTNGQLLIGGGSAPAWANITSTGGTLVIINEANGINIENPASAGIDAVDGDTGTANKIAGNVQVLGATNITTVGASDTITINVDNAVTLAGTLTLSPLGVGVMQTDATGLVTSNTGTNGQVLIGGGTAPAWGNITSTGGSVTITNGANSINIENDANSGITDVDGDTGTATQIGGNVQVLGGTNITTVGAGNTITVNLDNNVTLSGTLTLSAFGVGAMRTDPAGAVSSSTGTAGQVLIGNTGGTPAWNVITSTGATITVANGANTINIEEVGGVTVDDTVIFAGPSNSGLGPLNPPLGGPSQQPALDYTSIGFDPGGNITDDKPGEYTVPDDGKYMMSVGFRFYGTPGVRQGNIEISIITSNRTYLTQRNQEIPVWVVGGGLSYEAETVDVCMDLDAADTVVVRFRVDVGVIEQYRIDRANWSLVPAEINTFGSIFYIGA